MRLGGPVPGGNQDPTRWVAALRVLGYSAAYCPLDGKEDGATIRAFTQAARAADIVIAEVGAWCNPLSPDEETRRAALALCHERLQLADEMGARCCVNIAGSRGEQWDGPHPDNLTEDTFDLIVQTVRDIIDPVRPRHTFYVLEPMPWMYPDSAGAYLGLIRAIDRPQFGVHLDPVNLISSPQRYYGNTGLIRECFKALGPYIKSCHAKDVRLSGKLTVHLDEVRPGLGGLDYHTYLEELDALGPDMPLMLEHLATPEDYAAASDYVRGVAEQVGVTIR